MSTKPLNIEPGERRSVFAIYLIADDEGHLSHEINAKNLSAADVCGALLRIVEQLPRLIQDEVAQANPRVDVLEGQLAVEKQRAETLAHQVTEREAARQHEEHARRAAEQDAQRATSKLEELHRRPELVAERELRESAEQERDEAKTEIARLTAKLAEQAMAVNGRPTG